MKMYAFHKQNKQTKNKPQLELMVLLSYFFFSFFHGNYATRQILVLLPRCDSHVIGQHACKHVKNKNT